MRATLVKQGNEVIVECSTGDRFVFTNERVAKFFRDTVKRCVRGEWQLKMLLAIWRNGSIKASVEGDLRGIAKKRYSIAYQKRFDALMQRLGATFVPGPRGNRWRGYFVWRWQDAMKQAYLHLGRPVRGENGRVVCPLCGQEAKYLVVDEKTKSSITSLANINPREHQVLHVVAENMCDHLGEVIWELNDDCSITGIVYNEDKVDKERATS
jgi:hypothetical protein